MAWVFKVELMITAYIENKYFIWKPSKIYFQNTCNYFFNEKEALKKIKLFSELKAFCVKMCTPLTCFCSEIKPSTYYFVVYLYLLTQPESNAT